ncbi:MAG: glycosyltransferase family 4 protein [Candidatus Helarchaeota archaeon]
MKIVWIGGDADWNQYNSGAANAEFLYLNYLIKQPEINQIDFIDLPFPNPDTHQYPPLIRPINGIIIHLPRYKIRYKSVFTHLKSRVDFKGRMQLSLLSFILWFKFRGEIDIAKLEGKKIGTLTASPMYLAIVEPYISQLHRQAADYIKQLNPDIIHVLMEIFAPIAAILKQENDIPNVICAMEDWERQLADLVPNSIQYAAIDSCFDLSKWTGNHLDWFDKICPVSPHIQNYMARIGYPLSKIQEILPSPVDLTLIKPVDKIEARKKLGLPLNKRIILTVGRFMERKHYQDLIEILPSLPEDVILYMKISSSSSDITVYKEEKIFKRKLKEKKVANRVIIDKRKLKYEEMKYVYSACDIAVYPFVGEAFGMCAVETIACEKPLILYNSGNFPSFIKENGFLVEPSDLETLKEKILYLLENPEIAKEMGKKGKSIAKKFDIKLLGSRLINIYHELIKK